MSGRVPTQVGKGEYDKALADCREAIELDPNYGSASRVGGHQAKQTQLMLEHNTAKCVPFLLVAIAGSVSNTGSRFAEEFNPGYEGI